MTAAPGPAIRLRGVRHNNLKNFDLDLPLGQLIVVTGLSGSGKSSLAFDTLFAEGQRRYIETFSPYARQFFDRMDKPQVDKIEGIPPAIAIEQRNAVRTTRSTVGTMTEICEHMKMLWPHLAQLYCRNCGEVVEREPPAAIWRAVSSEVAREAGELFVTFDLGLSDKLTLSDSLELVARQGYRRLLAGKRVVRIEEAEEEWREVRPSVLTVIQDRLRPLSQHRARFAEACEQAYHFGKGKLSIWRVGEIRGRRFSRQLHCATCDIDYREPSSALFSFNHPVGACPTCRGFGRVITIDYDRAIPDRSRSLAEGAIRPWQTGQGLESQADLMKFCRKRKVPVEVPFKDLPKAWQEWVIEGDKDYGRDAAHEWPRAWYGVKGYFRWLESKAYKMHVRVLLSRYRAYSRCPSCSGHRLQPESLLYKSAGAGGQLLTLSDFYQLPVGEALKFMEEKVKRFPGKTSDPVVVGLGEVRGRLGYLAEVGLGYLSLDRSTRSLSGGETERVNLTTCLGTRLVNTLFVLDEPSVGLHARDTARLVGVVRRLRDTGNTVVVVEHEASMMRAADQIIDLGPGHGESGGEVVYQGSFEGMLRSGRSLTGQYLSGSRRMEPSARRPVRAGAGVARLGIAGATRHNLRNLNVGIPLNRLVCLTGVSGSGKTTLVREVLLPALEERLREGASEEGQGRGEETEEESEAGPGVGGDGGEARLSGFEGLRGVVLVDQSSLGRTPRSNPAVYVGAFDDIRGLFAQTGLARERGLNASAFSFNSGQGQCERCRGAGFEKIEMQFLSDVFVRCADCNGRRYRSHILEVKLRASLAETEGGGGSGSRRREWSIADVLEATVDEAVLLFVSYIHLAVGRRALEGLKLLQEVGLGYLRLGQPINTLSGGESQRLKLVRHIADFARKDGSEAKPTLFVFDEPTTGLHFEDVRVLLKVFQRLVDGGHSLLVIEHNLDVIRASFWLFDLGPEGGENGGRVVVEGTPEKVARCEESHTGAALRAAAELEGREKRVPQVRRGKG